MKGKGSRQGGGGKGKPKQTKQDPPKKGNNIACNACNIARIVAINKVTALENDVTQLQMDKLLLRKEVVDFKKHAELALTWAEGLKKEKAALQAKLEAASASLLSPAK